MTSPNHQHCRHRSHHHHRHHHHHHHHPTRAPHPPSASSLSPPSALWPSSSAGSYSWPTAEATSLAAAIGGGSRSPTLPCWGTTTRAVTEKSERRRRQRRLGLRGCYSRTPPNQTKHPQPTPLTLVRLLRRNPPLPAASQGLSRTPPRVKWRKPVVMMTGPSRRGGKSERTSE